MSLSRYEFAMERIKDDADEASDLWDAAEEEADRINSVALCNEIADIKSDHDRLKDALTDYLLSRPGYAMEVALQALLGLSLQDRAELALNRETAIQAAAIDSCGHITPEVVMREWEKQAAADARDRYDVSREDA